MGAAVTCRLDGASKETVPSIKRNLAYVYSSNAFNGLLGLCAVPLGLTFLGTGGYGLFSIYGVLCSYVALVDLGATKNFVRILAAEGEGKGREEHLQDALSLYLVLSGGLLAALPLLLVLVPRWLFPVSAENLVQLRWIIVCAVVEYLLSIPTVLKQMVCVADEQFDRQARFSLASGCCRYALMFLGFVVFKNPAVTVALVASRRLLDLYWGALFLGRFAHPLKPRFSLARLSTIAGQSAALSVAQFFQVTVTSLGSILVNRHLGIEALGSFRAVFDLASRVWFVSNGVGAVLFPRFSRLLGDRERRRDLHARIEGVLSMSWSAYNLVALAGLLLAPPLLRMMWGPQRDSLELFALVLLGVCLNAHSDLSYSYLQASGRYLLASALGAVTLGAMWLGFLFLVRSAGLLAVGWAWLASQLLYALLADALAARVSAVSAAGQARLFLCKMILFAANLIMVAASFSALAESLQTAAVIVVLGSSLHVYWRWGRRTA